MHTAEHAAAIEFQQAIDQCLICCELCVRAMEHCFELRGKRVDASQIRALSDCIATCQTTAGFMLRGSPLHARMSSVCADVCRACERECRRAGDDENMQQCAEACRRCAEACERLTNVPA
jgi:cob(I)alamin adenosyltransferase